MKPELPRLPVSAALPDLLSAMELSQNVVLAAPPGAGKTTLVPLHLLDQPWAKQGRIIMLEPRRLATRASARQMARLIGEKAGETVGYRTRLDTRISGDTRIEVVTEGVFTRMLLDEPELPGVSLVIFDEFHERSLDADFGLALALDVQSALREDLRILVMSATLDVARVSALLGDAPAIESAGRSYPVNLRYEERPSGIDIAAFMARIIRRTLDTDEGSVLAFLPGQAEIRRTAEALAKDLPGDVVIAPLFGNLSGAEQDAAIRPAEQGRRKIVLATSIAETSITIEGVRIVIDSGLQRLPVHEAATGITRLETVRVSRASADQRAGRAGRTAPGVAIRLWRREQTDSMIAFTPPAILASDLSGFVLDCASWGVTDPSSLALIDPPPTAAIAEARKLLVSLGAIDHSFAITPKGEMMRRLGLPTRLAAIVIAAAETGAATTAAQLAMLEGEQGLGGNATDLEHRLSRFRSDSSPRAKSARSLAQRIAVKAGGAGKDEQIAAGPLLLAGYPDRVAMRRGSDHGRRFYSLANGRGAFLEESDPLSNEDLLVVTDLTGHAASQRILSAARIDMTDIASRIEESEEFRFDADSGAVRARRVKRLGKLLLGEAALPVKAGAEASHALAEGIRKMGLNALPWSKDSKQLRERIGWLRRTLGDDWPDLSDDALVKTMDRWFEPFQPNATSIREIDGSALAHGFRSLVDPSLLAQIDRLAPTHFTTPAGSRLPIVYSGDAPALSVRVQELFGLKSHPAIAGGSAPLVLELLSPAHRPIQTTRDLPGFWTGSWRDVRADMRGRYPKHHWPEDPGAAEPTSRAKQNKRR